MANSRLVLALAITAVLASWLTALGGVAAGTAYSCIGSIGMSRGLEQSILAGAGGGSSSTGADADTFAGGDGTGADALMAGGLFGGLGESAPAPAPRGPTLSDFNCGSGYRLHWWTLAFHFLVWGLALRAAVAASRAAPSSASSFLPRAAPLSPLFAVAVAYATWCASEDFSQVQGGSRAGGNPLEMAFSLIARSMSGGGGPGAAAQASAAGFAVLAACGLFFMVACALAAQQSVVVLPTATVMHPPPPPPFGVAAIGKKASAVAAAAAAATNEDDEEAATGGGGRKMIGTGA